MEKKKFATVEQKKKRNQLAVFLISCECVWTSRVPEFVMSISWEFDVLVFPAEMASEWRNIVTVNVQSFFP